MALQKAEEGHACMQQFLEDEGWVCRLPGLALANQVLPSVLTVSSACCDGFLTEMAEVVVPPVHCKLQPMFILI